MHSLVYYINRWIYYTRIYSTVYCIVNLCIVWFTIFKAFNYIHSISNNIIIIIIIYEAYESLVAAKTLQNTEI